MSVLPPYLRQVEVEETERGELETGGEAVEQPVGEEVQVSGRPEQGQRTAEREGGGEEGGPERCPQETEEEAEALVTQPPLAVEEQPPQLQVGKGEERGVEQGVQDAQRQLHGARHRGAGGGSDGASSAARAGRRGFAAGKHRAVMEAAFVYGTTYQFVLTTEIALLESIGSDNIELAHLYFFHCKLVSDSTQQCRRTRMEQSLTTLNIHLFVKTMKAPLLEVPVEFLELHDVNLIISHVENNMHIEETQEDEDDDMEDPDMDIQDDEVAETVYRDRKRQLPLELTVELTEETFNATVMASDSIVLFYAGWHAVSMAFLQSYIDVAVKLKDTTPMLLTRINCADWSDVCTKQNVTEFPTVKMYKKGENPVSYVGMLGTEGLLKFIQLNRISYPVNVRLIQEAEEYLSGELYKDLLTYSSVSVLGLFSPTMTTAKEDFTEAGNYLKGSVITGIYSEEDVWILSNKYAATLPALLLARHKEGKIESIPLANTHVQDMVQIITDALLETFPEITVENLPTYLRLQKPLLILFSDGSINPQYRKVILTLVKQKHLDSLTPCWLNLKNTPVGRGILRAYFGFLPSLPLLVLVNLHSGGHVFAFPSNQSITEQSLVLWLKKLEVGLENHITILSAQEWKPPLPAYDFLSMMDAATAPHPTRKEPEYKKETAVQESDKEQHEDKSAVRKEPVETLRIKHWNKSNWFKETEKSLKRDKEL
ncbi:Thioredoxin domain-containing protein 16 [Sciurus carolinensis]|uniref:Thioredoxin domain-containing protein 16 n=1 Tax=Sciurus carolinensis TaxID=30640 RepID=A0AA41MRN6_SCICA|nr:Thioredoxin domain-containing protein 16 [Sciurus carolinensis]